MKSLLSFLVLGLAATPTVAEAARKMPPFKVERWLNSAPLTPEVMQGKVVLIDVWEYTCINWIRTAPFVKAWHRDYARHGLVVVGLHTPEFEFSKLAEHIDRGVHDHGLTYPVALDNKFATWRALGNQAWPTKYLFDAKGKLVKRWEGEGSYHEIEAEIRRALLAAHPAIELPPITPEATAFAKTGNPSYRGITGETYLGAERGETGAYRLEGEWRSEREYLELKKGTGKIILPFTAGEVNLVMQPGASGNAAVTVLLDGQPVAETRGADVGSDGVARFGRSGMIRLVSGAPRGKRVLTLLISDPGVRAFAFTFGP
jgi:thiol-disulfide isomerase/thioredoxin